MGLLAHFDGRKAFLRKGEWIAADHSLEKRLNEATENWIRETGGPALTDADPEWTVAEVICARLGGKVLLRERGDPSESRRVYFERRQLRLY